MDWFNSAEEPNGANAAPLMVSELSAIIQELLDSTRLQDIRVRGEVTNYKHHGRGHRYFSLSEKGGGCTAAVIKCVMWRSDADRLVIHSGRRYGSYRNRISYGVCTPRGVPAAG